MDFNRYKSIPWLIFLLAVATTIICSCNRQGNAKHSWSKIGEPFDSVSMILDRIWWHDGSENKIDSLIASLPSSGISDMQRKRREYWRQYRIECFHNEYEDTDTTDFFATQEDSIKSHFDYMRYRELEYMKKRPSFSEYYAFLEQLHNFFAETNNKGFEANAYSHISSLFYTIGDYDRAHSYIVKALEVSKKLGNKFQNLIYAHNYSTLLLALGDSLKAKEINTSIIQNPRFPDNIYLASRVLSTAYNSSKDVRYLYQALTLDSVHNRTPVRLAFHYMSTNPDSLKKYADISYSLLTPKSSVEEQTNAYFLKYKTSIATDKKDSALYFVEKYHDSYTEVMKTRDAERLMKLKNNRDYQEMLWEQERQRTTSIMLWFSTFVGILIIIGICVFILRTKAKNMKLRQLKAELELEKFRTQEAFSIINSQKNKQATDAIISDIDNMKLRKVIDSDTASTLQKNIGRHFNSDAEWKVIIESIDKVHPQFQSYLRKQYPDITQTLIRTAIYILMGISGKRLAEILSIEYNSVKKRRYNLRKLLKLKNGENLEAKIAELNEKSKMDLF